MYDSDKMNDSELARLLQEEYDREVAVSLEDGFQTQTESVKINTVTNKHSTSASTSFRNGQGSRTDSQRFGSSGTLLMSEISPVDPSLEFSDPTPDIRVLFLQFNAQFFWGALSSIEVKWSPRMTLCAGLCVYEGWGGLCSVRLSLPLLKLRPRKDLVETLLHEMIHAYLFVTDNDRDHSDHGPNFLSHMQRINKATGANISVYHTFNDEVESYQQHWWRCNGPCQQRAPYYGYVKRSMNRAPSARDLWWADHQASCGGVYTKIKEPEGYGQKKTGKGKVKDKPADLTVDIRTIWGQGHILGTSDGKSLTTERSSINSNGLVKATDSGFSSSKKSINGGIPKTVFGSTRVSSVTKSSASSATTNPSANGSTGISASTALNQLASINDTSKHLTCNSSASSGTKFSSARANILSDMCKPLSDSTSQQITDSTKRGCGVVDINVSHSSKTTPKADVLETHSGNKFHKIFQNSPTINKKWKSTPHLSNKKVVFPKNFVSVCEGGDFSKTPFSLKKRKKTKYIIDELDSNDGLWEDFGGESIANVRFLDSSSDNNSKEKTDSVILSSHIDKPLDMSNVHLGRTGHGSCDTGVVKKEPDKNPFYKTNKQVEDWTCLDKSDKARKEISRTNWSVQNKAGGFPTISNAETLPSPSSVASKSLVSENGFGKFTGHGHRLGAGENGTSFLSQIRKTWQQGSSSQQGCSEVSHDLLHNRHPRVSQVSQTIVRSPVSDKKRKTVEAFGEHDSSNSDSSKVIRNNKGERSSAVTAINKTDNELSKTPWSSVNERPNSINHDRRVPCPACSVMVPMDGINAHLDLCLLSG